jgi:hypothetical protein
MKASRGPTWVWWWFLLILICAWPLFVISYPAAIFAELGWLIVLVLPIVGLAQLGKQGRKP